MIREEPACALCLTLFVWNERTVGRSQVDSKQEETKCHYSELIHLLCLPRVMDIKEGLTSIGFELNGRFPEQSQRMIQERSEIIIPGSLLSPDPVETTGDKTRRISSTPPYTSATFVSCASEHHLLVEPVHKRHPTYLTLSSPEQYRRYGQPAPS